MRSSKSRSRNKSNRQRTLGNIVNRVFDSSGPEGKVRGTPQQIIEKYLTLARDAQLSNDRVAEQSFLQHAEHYTRMLGEAQREQAERQQQNGASRDDDRDDAGPAENGQSLNGNGQNGGQSSRHDRGDERRDDSRRDESRGENRRDNRREDRRDDRREERREDRAPAAERSEPVAKDAGLPPVIADHEDHAGPVETPESALADAPVAAPVAEVAPQLPLEETPVAAAPRRRTRSPAGTATRTRRKPAGDTADGGPAPEASTEKVSGE